MKKQRKNRKTKKYTENKAVCIAASINTCIACGREIPEGMLVCMECEIGTSSKRCMICDKPIAECEVICATCNAMIFRSQNKD